MMYLFDDRMARRLEMTVALAAGSFKCRDSTPTIPASILVEPSTLTDRSTLPSPFKFSVHTTFSFSFCFSYDDDDDIFQFNYNACLLFFIYM